MTDKQIRRLVVVDKRKTKQEGGEHLAIDNCGSDQ
jgi:hypothetical protein